MYVSVLKITKTLEDFDVEERPSASLLTKCENVKVLQKSVKSLNAKAHVSIKYCTSEILGFSNAKALNIA